MSLKGKQDTQLPSLMPLSLFDNMADGVCVTMEGKIQFMNKYLIDKFGDHKDKQFYSLFHNPDLKQDKQEMSNDEVTRYEWHSPITLQTFDIISSPCLNAKGEKCILSIFRDITEQKRLHIRLEGYYTRLKETNKTLKSFNKKLSAANQKLEELSIKDELTGLYNHRHFWDTLSMEFKRATRYSTPLSCLMIDIDLFKSINDLGSHSFGDYCLSEIGHMIRSQLRSIDIAARYGGEEFGIILPSTDYSGAKTKSEKIREKIEKKLFQKDGLIMNLTVSIGISSIPEDKIDGYNVLVESADKALYKAKMDGRNRVCLYKDLRLKEKETQLGEEKVKAIGVKLYHLMEGVKRDYIEATKNLIQSLESRFKDRKNHSIQVSRIAARIGEDLLLSQEQINTITFAALLHDLGYLAINQEVLLKRGRLTPAELDEIKEHPVLGAKIIKPIRYLQEEYYAVLHHHEWFNGQGYPKGLKGEEIPLGARILSIADAFEAMRSSRSYRKALSVSQIQREFESLSNVQFDPKLVPRFLKILLRDKDLFEQITI